MEFAYNFDEESFMEQFSFFTQEYINDPYKFYDYFLSKKPIFYNRNENCHVVCKYRDVKLVLQDYATFGSGKGVIPTRTDRAEDYGFDPIFLQSPPHQTRLRKLSANAFSISFAMSIKDKIKQVSANQSNKIKSYQSINFVSDYAIPVSLYSLISMLEISGEEADYIYNLLIRVVHMEDKSSQKTTSFMSAESLVVEFTNILKKRVEECEKGRESEFYQRLIKSGEDEDRLSLLEIFGMIYVSLIAGTEDLIRAFCYLLLSYQKNKEIQSVVINNHVKMMEFVMETLRLFPTSHYLRRVAEKDTEINGVGIKSGESVVALIGAANRDPDHFVNPGEFDINRDNIKSSLSFGHGPHVCIGKNIARFILEEGIRCFIQSFPDHSIDMNGSRIINRGMIIGYENMRVCL